MNWIWIVLFFGFSVLRLNAQSLELVEQKLREPSSTSTSLSSSGLIEKIYQAQLKPGAGADVISAANNTSIKKKLVEEAIAKTTESLILDLIGPIRYQKSKNEIQEKVQKQTGRFIPVMKTGELTKDAEGNLNLMVTMQVAIKTLESILMEHGLLYDIEATPIILPLINYTDLVQNKSYRWWRSIRDADQGQQYSVFEKNLQKNFADQGFYVECPNSSGLELLRPTQFDKDTITPEEWKSFAQLYKAAVVIEGNIRLLMPPLASDSLAIEVHLVARQVNSGKVLSELFRNAQWDKRDFWNQKRVHQWIDGTFKDLAMQVKESWQRGTFSSSNLRLIVKGGLPLSRFQKFKDQIQNQSRSVRQIHERIIGADELVFDIEVTANNGDLKNQLQIVAFDDQKFQLIDSDANSFTLIKAK